MERYVVKERTHPDTGAKGWGVWDTKEGKWVPGIGWQIKKGRAKHQAKKANRIEKENS